MYKYGPSVVILSKCLQYFVCLHTLHVLRARVLLLTVNTAFQMTAPGFTVLYCKHFCKRYVKKHRAKFIQTISTKTPL